MDNHPVDVDKLRTEHRILRKACIELKAEVRTKDSVIKKLRQENEELSIVKCDLEASNGALQESLVALQTQLSKADASIKPKLPIATAPSTSQASSSSSVASSASALSNLWTLGATSGIPEEEFKAVHEELEIKIQENERLHIQLFEMKKKSDEEQRSMEKERVVYEDRITELNLDMKQIQNQHTMKKNECQELSNANKFMKETLKSNDMIWNEKLSQLQKKLDSMNNQLAWSLPLRQTKDQTWSIQIPSPIREWKQEVNEMFTAKVNLVRSLMTSVSHSLSDGDLVMDECQKIINIYEELKNCVLENSTDKELSEELLTKVTIIHNSVSARIQTLSSSPSMMSTLSLLTQLGKTAVKNSKNIRAIHYYSKKSIDNEESIDGKESNDGEESMYYLEEIRRDHEFLKPELKKVCSLHGGKLNGALTMYLLTLQTFLSNVKRIVSGRIQLQLSDPEMNESIEMTESIEITESIVNKFDVDKFIQTREYDMMMYYERHLSLLRGALKESVEKANRLEKYGARCRMFIKKAKDELTREKNKNQVQQRRFITDSDL